MDFTPLLQSFSRFIPIAPLTKKKKLPFTVLILSPHPDDESIVGSLALRLQKENAARVINVAVTLGSKVERRKARLKELQGACRLLKFELQILPENWDQKEKQLRSLVRKVKPHLILAPHLKDQHPTHVHTGKLLMKIVPEIEGPCLIAWTEFWGAMAKPNLLVEVPLEIAGLQMRALEKHVGEVERNPYHLRLPAWMMDNVRRGSELIGGAGSESHQMGLGVLYKLQLAKSGKLQTVKAPPALPATSDLGQILRLILDAASGSSTRVK